MAFLEIEGKEYEARTDFKFDRVANDKYNQADKDGNKLGGFMNIYMNLLEFDTSYLLAFWDCALAHYKNDKPSLDKIEEALMNKSGQDEDFEPLFKEAFQKIDKSGFFKKRVNNFWKDFKSIEKMGTEEEQKQNKEMLKRLEKSRQELLA